MIELGVAALADRIGESTGVVTFRRCTRIEHVPGRSDPQATDAFCAFVLRSDARLSRIELGTAETIERAVDEWRADLGSGPSQRGISPPAVDPDPKSTTGSGERLRELVFDPLLPFLEGVEVVVAVPDDVLTMVPLDALAAAPSVALLGDRYRFEQRATLWDLLPDDSSAESSEPVFVSLGGADFGHLSGATPGAARSYRFDALPATREESRRIAALFEQSAGASARAVVLGGADASRSRLVEAALHAQWLHVATHGWFDRQSVSSRTDPQPIDAQLGIMGRTAEERIIGSSPMVLCGLALAGANLPADELGRYPGLITAEEIAGWDLSNCELAVLSACDTNVGIRRAGQGVASLQKALRMAGARSVITSLWKVPDEATKNLMLDFYRRLWVEKKPKHQALWEAKMRIRDEKDESGQPKYSTRDWAAWVLTGEPE
jgi:CHAT domain-containing protein